MIVVHAEFDVQTGRSYSIGDTEFADLAAFAAWAKLRGFTVEVVCEGSRIYHNPAADTLIAVLDDYSGSADNRNTAKVYSRAELISRMLREGLCVA